MSSQASGPLALHPLGSTGLQVTSICIGTAPLGSMPKTFAYEVPEERALATIRAFFAGPFNFLDTAASYGDGESERRIGIVLRELGGLPPGFVLATKADRDLQTGVFTGAQMRRSVEGILAKGPSAYPRYMYGQASPDLLRRARQMEEACQRHGVPLAAAALQFSLRDTRITSTIVGVTRPERLTETLKLAQHPVPDELW